MGINGISSGYYPTGYVDKRIEERQIEICRKERLIVNAGQRHMVFTRTIFI